ncbi:MAG: Bacteriophage replication protein, partial [Chthonomonadales bacterium]|nr:Bacteriophage replication protein [Chthonomonadales bacterium]
MPTIPPQSTPFPNAFIDTIMPTLRDTEWRLLCIIVRQTLGWHERESMSRKQQDWLTQRQLMRRTGRASAAVSHAIDALVRRNLIDVVTETGEILQTPQERQQWAGHLLFRLASHVAVEYAQENDQCRAENSSKSTQGCLKSEVRKANTTKETENKKTPNGVRHRMVGNGDKPIKSLHEAQDSDGYSENSSRPDPDVRRFLLLYCDLFARHSPRGEMPYMVWGR